MVGLALACAQRAPGHQLTTGARGESVVIYSVLYQLYGTLNDEYVVILGQIPNKTVFFSLNEYLMVWLRGVMTGPIIQPIDPGAGTDRLTGWAPFGAFYRGVCHDWTANLTVI